MPGGDRNDGAAAAVKKMVLVCDLIPKYICIYRISKRIPDWYFCARRSIYGRNSCRYCSGGSPFDLVVQTGSV